MSDKKEVSSQKLAINSEGAKRPTAGIETREFTSRGERGRVPPFIEKKRKKRRREAGFTLIELMVAIACMAILLIPVIYVYRSGSRSALQGLAKADITREARNILRQIHDDLKYSAFVLDYSAPAGEKPTDYFQHLIDGDNETSYLILRFPLHGAVDEAIEPSGNATAFRVPVQIRYELKKEDQYLFSLYRKEGDRPPQRLSKRVNFFEIQENQFAPEKTSWVINLQLAEIVRPLPGDVSYQQLKNAEGQSVKSTEHRLMDRTSGVQVADFYDVVASDYYTVFRKSRFIPNWHTLLKKP